MLVVVECNAGPFQTSTAFDVYSARTLQKLRDIAPIGGLFYWSGNSNVFASPMYGQAFNNGRLRVSRDGNWIFATLPPSSVAVYSTTPAW